ASGSSRQSAAAEWQNVPAELKAGGYPQRELFFVPQKSQTVGQDPEGGACRGSSPQDASNPDPRQRNYYATWTAFTLKECFEICSWKQDCTGVEFSENHSYCEVWNAPIHWTQPLDGYQCYLAYPQSGQPDGIRWKAGSAEVAVSGMAGPKSTDLVLEAVLGAVLLLGIVAAILCACRRWKKPSRRAKASEAVKKRGLDIDTTDKHTGDATHSGDELQPLVGGASELSSPTGSFVSGVGGHTWNPASNFSFAASGRPGVGYEALSQGAQAPGPGAQDGDQTTYLQQLRQWL
ncbi:unnamed protein product, partial [Symbiodinium pilosum]